MENNKMNILVEFELSGEPVSLPYYTSGNFENGDEESALTAVCTVLQHRKQKAGCVVIHNLKIHYNGQLVFEKSEYCIPNYTPAL
ncbi:hypothetical protein AB9N12_03445 [Bacteroides sp. AN502(2024)]|uniref:hypothetical protein n=1 Tax=Bacteroides sp. AN502(2024) TaxID=3160599 RepID=UPI003514BA46